MIAMGMICADFSATIHLCRKETRETSPVNQRRHDYLFRQTLVKPRAAG
jgi:hypothetical protein